MSPPGRVAHASRVLVSVSRRNELRTDFRPKEKSAMTRRHRQHARRVCYPKQLLQRFTLHFILHPNALSPRTHPPAWRDARLTRAPPSGDRGPDEKPPLERPPPIPLGAIKSS